MKSPGAPSLRREVERKFWVEIAKGLTSENAATAVGVSPAAGTRWFNTESTHASIRDRTPIEAEFSITYQVRVELRTFIAMAEVGAVTVSMRVMSAGRGVGTNTYCARSSRVTGNGRCRRR